MKDTFLWIFPLAVKEVPHRLPLSAGGGEPLSEQRLELLLAEYTAIRGEITTSLSNQVSVLSFGAATVGLLVAAAAALWENEGALSGALLFGIVPLVCFLALAVYFGEQIRLLRASLFLRRLETHVNAAFGDGGCALAWEQWGTIRRPDLDASNRRAISLVFGSLAVGFAIPGYVRLNESDIDEPWTAVGTLAALEVGALACIWLVRLSKQARAFATEARNGRHPGIGPGTGR
jgi:hypothetical protein